MKEFFENPLNVLGTIAVIMIILFVMAFLIAFHNMMVDHYCTYELPKEEAIKIPKCKPYFK